MSYQDPVKRLGRFNIQGLWETAALLSTLEIHDVNRSRIFPLLNLEKVRLFANAILESKADTSRQKELGYNDLAFVLNNATDGLIDPRVTSEVHQGGERREMLFKLRKVFSRWASVQLRPQELNLLIQYGRLVALLVSLPQRLGLFALEKQAQIESMSSQIHNVLGVSVVQLVLIHVALIQWYQQVNAACWEYLEKTVARPRGTPFSSATALQADKLATLLRHRKMIHGLIFSALDLIKFRDQSVSIEEVNRFLEMFSKPTDALRHSREEIEYQYGINGWRLNPLERYPVVDLGIFGGVKEYVIPNLRAFCSNISDMIHFTLQDSLGNQYNEYRGMVIEVYLRLLLEDKTPRIQVIQERAYGKSEVRGPDLTLIDHATNTLIAIEAKARRVRAETRSTMDEVSFDENFRDIYQALSRLPKKIEHLYSHLPEYADVQNNIDKTRINPPLCVAIVGESTYFMNEIIRYRAENEATHPLYGFTLPFCVMSIDSFEYAVELSVVEDRSLTSILRDYWDDSADLELGASPPDLFRGHVISPENTFAASFLEASLATMIS